LSKSTASPPTMIVNVPLRAPTSPPETGASSMPHSISVSLSATCSVASGLMVVISTTSEPGCKPSASPSFPNSTCSTSGVSLSIVMMSSQRSASSGREFATSAPAFRNGCVFSLVRFQTHRSNPSFNKLSDIDFPMMPSPANPIFIFPHILLFCSSLAIIIKMFQTTFNHFKMKKPCRYRALT